MLAFNVADLRFPKAINFICRSNCLLILIISKSTLCLISSLFFMIFFFISLPFEQT
jgi:hypothetical protein